MKRWLKIAVSVLCVVAALAGWRVLAARRVTAEQAQQACATAGVARAIPATRIASAAARRALGLLRVGTSSGQC